MTPDRERRYIEEIETLQEENRQLKDRLGYRDRAAELNKLAISFKLTPGEAKMLLTLYRASGRVLSKEDLLAAADAKWEAEPKGVDVRVCKLRAKMNAPAKGQPTILTAWGQGFSLTPLGQQIVRATLAREEDADTRI